MSGPHAGAPMVHPDMGMGAVPQAAGPMGRPLESLPTGAWAAPSAHPRSADEYLRDGGDRAFRVEVDAAGNTSGLDVEDAVLHYDDGLGRQVVASNRVVIYSPRFGSVRSVLEPVAYQSTRTGEGMLGSQGAEQTLAQELADVRRQALGPEGMRSRLRASGLNSDKEPGAVVGDAGVEGMLGTASVTETIGGQRIDVARQSTGPEVELTVAAAQVWTAEQFPKAIVTPEAASAAVADVAPQSVHRNEPLRPQVGRIHLTKEASTGEAVPGEIVEFRIAYENVGRAAVDAVVLVDHLTTRLEYVDGAWNEQELGFTAMEQAGGSTILQWRLRGPLGGGERGEVRFRARVR